MRSPSWTATPPLSCAGPRCWCPATPGPKRTSSISWTRSRPAVSGWSRWTSRASTSRPGRPTTSPTPTPDWLGGAVRAVARTLGAVHLLGHSFGGLTARAAVIAEPALFASLTLLDSGPAKLGGSRTAQIDILEPLYESGGIEAVYAQLERLAMADPAWPTRPQALKDFLRKRFVGSTPAGLRGMGTSLVTEPDRVDELRATGVRVLVAYGEHDNAWRPQTQAVMAERLGARTEVIAAAVHSPAIEATEATVKILEDFWSQP
nr:alpha/beta fold hydrolase [Fodinicola feengrottensis]